MAQMRLQALLTPTFFIPLGNDESTQVPRLLFQDVCEPHAKSQSLITCEQYFPRRPTDKFFDVCYGDHLKKDIELLPSTVLAPFWPEIMLYGEVQHNSRLSSVLIDMQTFLKYMYPSRASGPLSIHVSHRKCSSNGCRSENVDLISLQLDDEVLALLVILETPGTICEEDWKSPTSSPIDFGDTSKVAGNYLAFLQSLGITGLNYAAFLDFKSTVIVNISRFFSCVSFEDGPYLPTLTLLSEVFSRRWDCSKFSHQTGEASFPRVLVSGAGRNPNERLQVDLSAISMAADLDLYDAQNDNGPILGAMANWHNSRLRKGQVWLDALRLPGHELRVVSVISAYTTSSESLIPPLLMTAKDPLVRFFQNILFQATSAVRPSTESFSLRPGDSIFLESSLRSGREFWGQTFEVRVSPLGAQRLVLKIYDERLFPRPAWEMGYDRILRIRRWPNAEDSWQREERAYRTLRFLQGSGIPRSYGFYRIQLPDGEMVAAHLLEYVEGSHLDDTLLNDLSEKEQQNFFNKGMALMGAMFLLGVNHTDLQDRPDQIICLPSACPGSAPNLVLIDFGMSNLVPIDESWLLSDWAWDLSISEDSRCMNQMLNEQLGWTLPDDKDKHPEVFLDHTWEILLRERKFGILDVNWDEEKRARQGDVEMAQASPKRLS
ncbi:hypothetical protein BT69DRAFT_1299589 [Atractiella rhizophila]|nr:hypothetical protein BT69DRAFT_1299589 [Atractiella rhizophila]